jgi:hypothetical protein
MVCGITHGVFVLALKRDVLITMFPLALKSGVFILVHGRFAAGRTTMLWPCGRNEDRWLDVAPAATVV